MRLIHDETKGTNQVRIKLLASIHPDVRTIVGCRGQGAHLYVVHAVRVPHCSVRRTHRLRHSSRLLFAFFPPPVSFNPLRSFAEHGCQSCVCHVFYLSSIGAKHRCRVRQSAPFRTRSELSQFAGSRSCRRYSSK